MTDGPYIDTRHIPYSSGQIQNPAHGQEIASPSDTIDLDTLSMQIENQPTIFTHSSLLELITNDLYRRRNYPAIAGAIKQAAKDLRAMPAYCECHRKIIVRVSTQRSPNANKRSTRRAIKNHDMCRQCQARLWESMKPRKRKEGDNEAAR